MALVMECRWLEGGQGIDGMGRWEAAGAMGASEISIEKLRHLKKQRPRCAQFISQQLGTRYKPAIKLPKKIVH